MAAGPGTPLIAFNPVTTRPPRRPDTRTWPPAPDGVLVVDKPAGWTSHDVVAKIRYLARTRKVGHAGTLDPMATGVLVIGVGRATRLLTYIVGADKEYLATIRLGEATSSDDAQGDLLAVADAAGVDDAAIRAGVVALTGPILQVPNAVSAIKVDGKRAYALARSGESVELAARPVTVARFEVLDVRRVDVAGADGAASRRVVDVDVLVECSSGTYVRALARDLGADLGVGGHLTALRRTRVGGYAVADAPTLAALEAAAQEADRPLPVLPLASAARAIMPARELSDDEVVELLHGRRVPRRGEAAGSPVAAIAPDGTLVAVTEVVGDTLRPTAVLGSLEDLVARTDQAGDARGQE